MPYAALLLVAATAAPVPTAEPIARLRQDVVPRAQSIRLELDPRDADYKGSVSIAVEVKKPVTSFDFHAEEIRLGAATIRTEAGGAPIPLTVASAGAEGIVTATAKAPLAPGRYTLSIDFTNEFDTRAIGLYRLETGGAAYAFTQFEAVDARKAFPCWDEPAYKIPYKVTLVVPESDAAFANTLEESSKTADGKRTVAFRETRPLPSYLIAVAVGPLDMVPIPGTSVPARVIVPKGSAALAADAVKMTPPILAALERYFGSKHPYEKLDLIAVPEYWYGAMENPGLITFREESLLLDPGRATDSQRERLATYLAHEIAHMWFGDLVTMAWWDDLWLNESFASWMEDKITAEVFPEFQTPVTQVSSMQRVMFGDARLSTRAMRQPVKSVASLLQSADELAYVKGSAVLAMTESWLTPETFRKGVLAYLKAYEDGNATGDDLWKALSKASGKDVTGVLKSFLDQPGVPLVSATLLPDGRVKLTQSRFLNAGSKAPKAQTWKIPVVLEYPGAADGVGEQRVLLTEAETIVKLGGPPSPPAWIHPNGGEAGYYRWSVPRETLTALTKAAKRLSVRERVGLLGNAGALLEAGDLTGDAYLALLEEFAKDPEPLVVGAVVKGLDGVRETFFAETDDPRFSAWVRRTLRPALDRIGTVPRAGEPEAVTELRPDLLEALVEWGKEDAATAQAKDLARAYLGDPSTVPPSLATPGLTLAATKGDAELFETFRQRFENAKSPTERTRYLAALASFRDAALVDRALDYVFSGPLRPQETMSIPRRVAQAPSGRDKTWTWMTGHYDEIAKRLPADFIIFMPYFAAGCSETRLDAAKAFFADPHHAPAGTDRELAKVEEGVRDCARLSSREGDAVRRYLAGK
ncbi:MAG TPA: M1 family metallopeptidase [Candidatus Polarisedimenticolaceae bacterium]|nr:M1 family metallopeptidase [Candidatus Polarisedimenticolaceae bacterium]